MGDEKIIALVEKLEKFRKSFENDRKASKAFLIKVGIVTKKGDLRSNYKHLCIPPGQA